MTDPVSPYRTQAEQIVEQQLLSRVSRGLPLAFLAVDLIDAIASALAAAAQPPKLLRDNAEYIVKRFREAEDAGYRSRERQFALELLEKALAALPQREETGQR